MPRVKKPTKVKEPVRLRTKKLADGSQSLYLDIYRFGKRTYEYLKLYLIPETDNNARRQNQATMNAANAIKSKRIIELTNGEAGIETKERVYLLDWMNTYKENQAKRGKKDGYQIDITIRILKDYAGERMLMDQIDKTFCQNYLDYLQSEYRSRGKRVSNYTLHTYYRVLNGALNAAVRAEIIKSNPFTKISKSEKIRLPESKRSYMTIEEVRALIATPMKNESVKGAYLFSCFCGLRISDIIKLQWKDVFVDRGQYRLSVSMQKTKEPIYLPLSPEALKWMPARGDKAPDDNVFDLPSPAMVNILIKPWAKAAAIRPAMLNPDTLPWPRLRTKLPSMFMPPPLEACRRKLDTPSSLESIPATAPLNVPTASPALSVSPRTSSAVSAKASVAGSPMTASLTMRTTLLSVVSFSQPT